MKKKPQKRPRRGLKPEAPPRPMTLMLLCRHTINGHAYGPGRTVVSDKIGRSLAHAEQQAANTDALFNEEKAGIVIGTGARHVRVDPSQFQEAWLHGRMPAFSVRG